jgi:ubiquinone/menaquinone biosynthesis C-methylase UbiE
MRVNGWILVMMAVSSMKPAAAVEQGASQSQQQHRVDHAHHRFDDIERWVKTFEDEERLEWQKPDSVIEALGLVSGQVVADLGAGTGYFTRRMARAVEPSGRALAIDIEPGMVEYVRQRAQREGQTNLEASICQADDPGLAAASVDGVLIVNTLHHIQQRPTYYPKLAGALRPGGWLAIVDFHKRELPVGPPPEDKLSREQVIAELERAGWSLGREETFLPYQYFLIFKPPAQ